MLKPLNLILPHLYLSPLEQCNLNCQLCYTNKSKAQLSQPQVLDFVARYRTFLKTQNLNLQTITLCGGELFLLDWMTDLINKFTDQGIITEIITNGTIDRLSQLKTPNKIDLIVSLDGLQPEHDANRGPGTFNQSFSFLKKAQQLGFHTEVFTIVSQKNYQTLAKFEQFLQNNLKQPVTITYHPRKPRTYLKQHPKDNHNQAKKEFGFLTKAQLQHLLHTKKVFPPKNLGCFQMSVMSDGMVYGCCEGTKPLGTITDDINELLEQLQARIKVPAGFNEHTYLGCSQPDFACGLKQLYNGS